MAQAILGGQGNKKELIYAQYPYAQAAFQDSTDESFAPGWPQRQRAPMYEYVVAAEYIEFVVYFSVCTPCFACIYIYASPPSREG